MTHYMVLIQDELKPSVWTQFTAIEARSARSAITKALEGEDNPYGGGGTLVAVPFRSWQPVTVKVETKTALRFS